MVYFNYCSPEVSQHFVQNHICYKNIIRFVPKYLVIKCNVMPILNHFNYYYNNIISLSIIHGYIITLIYSTQYILIFTKDFYKNFISTIFVINSYCIEDVLKKNIFSAYY